MILIELTVNGVVKRISTDYQRLTHLWEGFVKSMVPPAYTSRSEAGGYVEPQAGAIELSPEMFTDDYPPPVSCAVTIKFSDTTEEAAVTGFTGTAHLQTVDSVAVRYELYGPTYTQTFTEKTLFSNAAPTVFDDICSDYLSLSSDLTYMQLTPQINIHRWVNAGELVIDVLSDMAESISHIFYIDSDDGKAHFVSMSENNGDILTLDEFEFFQATYTTRRPHKQYASSAALDYTLAGTYGYGEVDNSNMARNIEEMFVRVGTSSGDDHQLMIHDTVIPYDYNLYYMMEVRAKKLNASDVAATAFGFVGVGEDRETIVDVIGNTDLQQQAWIACNGSITTTWTTYRGYAHGQDSPPPTFPCWTIGGAGGLYPDVKYFRPAMAVNIGTTATTYISHVRICEVDSLGNFLEELFFDTFSNADLAKWGNYGQAPFGPPWGTRSRYPSFVSSRAAMATALGNRKTTLESSRATLPVPMESAYVVPPGARIEWTDASVSPGAAVSAWMRVRNISYDPDKNKIIYEGEGGVA